ncbi:hypothetical protein HX13_17400 [Chryseobacterium sp. P1-3]|uniref:hypothetical protein n=1 Tax=Chryseobacterium sp. (strain P1-3) TaxID=1517683 RepID=UPI0004E621D3|nr:hypothetical protein [Chryseobacterium sp. P1-3]KFF73794.1 hypothetical protein HX13_17400 [Chryseobacterium sp. P1-3]
MNIRLDQRLQSPALYDPSFDVAITQIGGGLVLKGMGLGGKYLISNFSRATGGLKQWKTKPNYLEIIGELKIRDIFIGRNKEYEIFKI